MSLDQLEHLINISDNSPDNEKRAEAARMLDAIRVSPDCWQIGIELLLKSINPVSKFFGLTLIRGCLSAAQPPDVNFRVYIREHLWQWINEILSKAEQVPQFIINNAVSVLTLLMKLDFPEVWPTAFADLLTLSSMGWNGVDIIVRVLTEFDLEVVAFNEQRTRQENSHNTIVKDTMRVTSAVRDIVNFLCFVCVESRRSNRIELASSSLSALSHFVSWIDINLFVELGLPTVWEAMNDSAIRGSAFQCIFELLKKGMDSTSKVKLIVTIQLLEKLRSLPLVIQEDDESGLNELAPVIDMIVLEFLNCWNGLEDSLIGSLEYPSENQFSIPSSPETSQTLEMIAILGPLMHECLTYLAFPLFSHPDTDIFVPMLPSMNRLVALVKKQQQLHQQPSSSSAKRQPSSPQTLSCVPPFVFVELVRSIPGYFFAVPYLTTILPVVGNLMKFPSDFEFRLEDEDDIEVIDAISEVRKLFIYIVRVNPDIGFQFIQASWSSLPQPVSQVPFNTIQAILRLIYSFAEGVGGQCLLQDNFRTLIQSIYLSDVLSHRHPQVLLQFFELGVRYLKQSELSSILSLVNALIDSHGLHNRSEHIRSRAAYMLLKVVEGLEGKSSLLLPVIQSFSDLVLTPSGTPSILPPPSELYLLESISYISSSEHDVSPSQIHQQLQLLHEMASILLNQINQLLQQYNQSSDISRSLIIQTLCHKVNSFVQLTRGYLALPSSKTHGQAIPVFEFITQHMVQLLHHPVAMDSKELRERSLMYFHAMLKVLPLDVIVSRFSEWMMAILAHERQWKMEVAEMDGVVRFLIQAVAVMESKAESWLNSFWDRLSELYQRFWTSLLREHEGAELYPAYEVDRGGLQRIWLQFLQQILNHGCGIVLIRNPSTLEACFGFIMNGLQGGQFIRGNEIALPLRKISIECCVSMAKIILNEKQQLVNDNNSSSGGSSNNSNSTNGSTNNNNHSNSNSNGNSNGNSSSCIGPTSSSPSSTSRKSVVSSGVGSAVIRVPLEMVFSHLTSLSQTFWNYLFHNILPISLQICVDGKSLQLKDASTQGFLIEVANFVFHLLLCDFELVARNIQNICITQHWPESFMQQLMNLIAPLQTGVSGHLNQFREGFKKLIRSTSSSK